MRSSKQIGLAVACLSLLACGASELLGPDASQGIEGQVFIGPQCPVQPADGSCPDLPYAAAIDVRTGSGSLVTRVHSGEDGLFRVGLRPGDYELDPEPGDPLPVASTQYVTVKAGQYTAVVISYDTGIR
jgi:hypothetical protein